MYLRFIDAADYAGYDVTNLRPPDVHDPDGPDIFKQGDQGPGAGMVVSTPREQQGDASLGWEDDKPTEPGLGEGMVVCAPKGQQGDVELGREDDKSAEPVEPAQAARGAGAIIR